jgi:hypothetical protein
LETAAGGVLLLCKLAEHWDPNYFQLAHTVATFYKLETGDDSLVQFVSDAMAAKGYSQLPIAGTATGEPPTPSLFKWEVTTEQLRTGGLPAILERIQRGDSEEARGGLAAAWGKVILMFALDNDPRAVPLVPEAREYVRKLHRAHPYVPALLHPDPKVNSFFTYFGCLADLEAITPLSDGAGIDMADPSVVTAVRESLAAIRKVAPTVGKDAREACRTLVAGYPPEFIRDHFADLIERP